MDVVVPLGPDVACAVPPEADAALVMPPVVLVLVAPAYPAEPELVLECEPDPLPLAL